MEVKQIYEIVNDVTKEVLGLEDPILTEDLSNVVDVGSAIFDANAFDNYVKSLINKVGRVRFVNRVYKGGAPSVLMDSWEYGSIMQKISSEMPEAVENESWLLVDGTSYDQNIFRKPKAITKFYNKRTTFEIDRSITERQVKESFSSADQLNAFISMLYNEVDKSLTVKTDALIMRTINNFIGETVYNEFPGITDYSNSNSAKCVNLLKEYNTINGTSLTPSTAIYNPEFIRYAVYKINIYETRISKISCNFNIGGQQRFTPKDYLHLVLHNDFKSAADIYLQSDTFHDSYTKLPYAESVAYWQGSGNSYAFDDTSAIDITTGSGNDISFSGILGVMFDREALGVTNFDRRVTTHYNAKAEFTNYFYKQDAGYFNDMNENFVVFFIA